MACLTVYQDNHGDSTVVSNLFIDEYMKDANDAQLKVYLYLLRMMSAMLPTSVSDIADKFNHTEKDVLRALKYWEQRQLLDLDYDSGKNLVGIHIRDLRASREKDGALAPQAMASFVPVPTVTLPKEISTALAPEAPPEPSPVKTDPPQEAASQFEKPSYSADQLREFKNRQRSEERRVGKECL